MLKPISKESKQVVDLLYSHLLNELARMGTQPVSLVHWNDNCAKHEDVLALIDNTIKRLEAV